MKRRLTAVLVSLAALACCVPVMAHTGYEMESPIELTDELLPAYVWLHDDASNFEYGDAAWYMGWNRIGLTNKTSTAWSGLTIRVTQGVPVAIVKGSGLVDEHGTVADSLFVDRAASIGYSNSVSASPQAYKNGATGWLWKQVDIAFVVPVEVGQKVSFRFYGDNAYYPGWKYGMCSYELAPIAVAVPEPGSIVALLSGLTGLACFARRKKQ